MTKQESLSLAEARALVLERQGLAGAAPFGKGAAGALAAIQRLGYVQLDTIHIVERAHHHVLWSRVPGYQPPLLDELLAARSVFEYWSHAAAILPMEDYRFCLRRMQAFAEGRRHWFRRNRRVMSYVLDRIRAEGPLGSADFEKPPGRRGGPWFEWTPTKRALEHLFHEGSLMVSARKGFHKRFDLPERVLPSGTPTSLPSPAEQGRWHALRALGAQGVLTAREMVYLRNREKPGVERALLELVADGTARAVRIPEAGEETFYALSETLERATPVRSRELRLLNPFDNLVIQRRRLARLFGFDYLIECYVPEPKRRFGYFCLPILSGTRFVGRLDPKADRADGVLRVRALHVEPGAKLTTNDAALARALRSYARFNACETVSFEREARAARQAARK